ncbi:MAG: HYExAFE family protein [Planctomycetaceae bacterium]|nr:HYExAFE family protein [Planctomycetaceae bacterium]
MAIRANHYDAAFEAFLRGGRTPYVAVNEARRALWGDMSLKSLDFVVYSPMLGNLLIDVKGRLDAGPGCSARRWENWATADDLECLQHWQQIFGESFRALLVFAYQLPTPITPTSLPEMLRFRNRSYAFYGVWADDYRRAMKLRSPKWETVWLPSTSYRELRFSLANLGTAT